MAQVEIELLIFSSTEKAIMVGREETDESDEIWLPKRACDPVNGYELEESVDPIPMLVSEALLIKKGLL